jgi:hypothetical protein
MADLMQHVFQEHELVDAYAHIKLLVVLTAKPHRPPPPENGFRATVGQVGG